jgi:hypothetical protein
MSVTPRNRAADAPGRKPLSAVEQDAMNAWLASNVPQCAPRFEIPRPSPHHGAPVVHFALGQTVPRETQHAATAGAVRIALPEGCLLAEDGRVCRGSARRVNRISRGAS